MGESKTTRDYELDYLTASYRLQELLETKNKLNTVSPDFAKLHQQLMAIGDQMPNSPNRRDLEYDYFLVLFKLQEILETKNLANFVHQEFDKTHAQLARAGANLIGSSSSYQSRPIERGMDVNFTDMLSKIDTLQRQLEEMKR